VSDDRQIRSFIFRPQYYQKHLPRPNRAHIQEPAQGPRDLGYSNPGLYLLGRQKSLNRKFLFVGITKEKRPLGGAEEDQGISSSSFPVFMPRQQWLS
jgi:hypothetical protein